MVIMKYRSGHFMFDVSVMVTTVFGDATLSSLVGRYKRPVGTCCLSIQGRRASNVEKKM